MLTILKPRGAVSIPVHETTRTLEIAINVEVFAGHQADEVRSDTSSWRVCYASSLDAAPGSTFEMPTEAAICVKLSDANLPNLELPPSAGILGAVEHWRIDAWLRHVPSGRKVAQTSAKWTLTLHSDARRLPATPEYNNIGQRDGYRIRGGALFADLQVLAWSMRRFNYFG